MSGAADVPRAPDGARGRAAAGRAPARDLGFAAAFFATGAMASGCAGAGGMPPPDPGFVQAMVQRAQPDAWAELLQHEAGCAPALGAGLDGPSLGLAGLGDPASAAVALPRDVEGLAALVDRFVTGAPALELVRAAELPADAEVAGPAICAGLDPTRVAIAPGEHRLRYIPAAPAERADLAAGAAALAAGKSPEARMAFSAAAAKEPVPVAAPGLAIAHSYGAEERWSEAAAAFTALQPRFERIFAVHAGQGDALRRVGKRGEAADAWARAIALAPGAAAFARKVAADPFVELRPQVPPPAARSADGHWTLRPARARAGSGASGVSPEAAAAALGEAQAYAGCKEAFRRSAPLQEAVLGAGLAPWRWSPAEESACTAVWLRAYQRNRDAGRPEDEGLDDLVAIAKAGFLTERSLFDVGALAHPLAPALLDQPALTRLFAFVAGHRVIHRRQGGWLF